MDIRKSTEADRSGIEKIHTKAFGEEKGPEIATLVNGLFDDTTAAPLLSLVAVENDQLVGHILYTKSVLTEPIRLFQFGCWPLWRFCRKPKRKALAAN